MNTPVEVNPNGMINMSVDDQRTIVSATVLANAGELGVDIIKQIAGNDISTAIGGETVTTDMLYNLLYQRIAKRLEQRQAAVAA